MTLKPPGLLLFGGALFLAGVALLLAWMSGGHAGLLVFGIGAISASALSLALGGLWMRRASNPLEARKERRLWRSGPLGRWWLGRRKRLP
jgi:hypothetical protein